MSLLVRNLTASPLVFARLEVANQEAVVRTLAGGLEAEAIDAEVVTEGVLVREQVESTAIGGGIALPHVRVDGLVDSRVCIASLARPVPWSAADDVPVDLVFLLVGNRRLPGRQLRVLARISRLVGLEDFLADLRAAETSEAVLEAVEKAETRHF